MYEEARSHAKSSNNISVVKHMTQTIVKHDSDKFENY
jgi:hypothetical protein